MSVASLSHQSLQDHVSKPSPFVSGDHDQQYTVAPTAVTNLFTHQQQQQQQQQQDDALSHPHQKKDSQDLAQYPHLPTDLEQQHSSSNLDTVSEPSELSPPSTPTPLPKTTKNMDSLRDPLIHSNQAQTPTTTTATTTTTTTLDHPPSVQSYPFDVQTLHERTLQQFQMDDNDEIKFKRHSTHGAIIHAKRRDTTMGILPLHPTEYDPSSSSSTAYPLMTSTTTAGATSSSFIHDGTQSTKTATVTRHGSTSTLTRHNTTGHTLQQRLNKHKKPVTELSEEFQKELTARRKAFRRLSRRKKDMDIDDDRVMIGTRIGEGHQNYVLMYNMLTGIRIAVGRVSAKIDRALTTEDFSGAHKLAFDVTGDELTPGAKYDFKFKDYAPWVFRHLREQFGIDPADYLISLTSKYILSELGSPGKSGSFFYYSRDYRFIIKTIHHTEHKFMRKILKQYHDHVINNPNTLLCRYYGLHRVKLPRGRKIHFVVMGNVFPPNKDVHETYDLKGSTIGRLLPEEEIKRNPSAVMKDLNWEARKRKLKLGPQKRGMFIKQLVRDVRLLVHLNIMDYSLLIGVHDMLRGNKDNVRDSTLHAFQPDTKGVERRDTLMKRRQSKAQVVRKAIAQANPDRLDLSELPDDPEERRNCVFYSDEGGFQATDELDQPTGILYFMGVIDILTPYDAKKKTEHLFKSLTQDKTAISSVKPSFYGDRFMGFMAKTLEHNQDIPQEYHMSS